MAEVWATSIQAWRVERVLALSAQELTGQQAVVISKPGEERLGMGRIAICNEGISDFSY